MSDVTLQVNGRNYRGWQKVKATLGMEQCANSFDLTITEKFPGMPDALGINLGDSCRLLIGATPVITGYVDDVFPSYDANSHSIQITGRDKTGDLVDCAAVHKSGQWHNSTLTRIATDLCAPYGIKVIAAVPVGKPFPSFSIWHSETAFECLERAARMRGILLISDGLGNLLLTRASKERITTQLVKGQNIERGAGMFSWKDRYSEYIVKGQSPAAATWAGSDSDTAPHLQTKASIADKTINRYRAKVIIAEPGDSGTYKDRAIWEMNVHSGRGSRAEYTVTGWEHSATGWATGNGLWLPNRLVPIKDDFLGIDGDMLIAQSQFTLDENTGSTTVITVCKPEAFEMINLPDKHKKKKEESARWS